MSGGAGAFGAGLGPAGFDPIADPTPARNVTPPRAILFQIAGTDYPLDDDGRYQDIHPVDQWVALQLGIVASSLGSSPNVGNTLRSITHVGAPSTANKAADAVRLALADGVNDGRITIAAIEYEAKSFGGFKLAVSYVNLRKQADKARTITVTQ